MNKYEQNYRITCRQNTSARWMETSIVPLATDIGEHLGLPTRVLGPFGLRAECMIIINEERVLSISPSFDADHNLQLYYDTGEVVDRFAPDTIGAMNGMNKVTMRLPATLEEIVPLFRQYK